MVKPPITPADALASNTKRSKAFRDRLAETSLTRWEIVASEETKDNVRKIARIEGLTPGVAADALLGLGIEAYLNTPGAQAQAEGVPATTFASNITPIGAITPSASSLRSVAAPLASKSLAAYSSRPGVNANSPGLPSPAAAAAKSLQGFFDRAKNRKKP